METAAIHVGNGRSLEEAWTVGYQIERVLKSGGALALEFDPEITPTPELFDVLLNKLPEARARGLTIEIRNMPSWLRFALESPEAKPSMACAS